MASRTLKILSPHMKGKDVSLWQATVKELFADIGIDAPIAVDGDYGISTRGYTASLLTAYGVNAGQAMANGITPALRIKMRNKRFTEEEIALAKKRVGYRRDLRDRYRKSEDRIKVHRFVTKINEDGWGFYPKVHDGIDVQTPADAWVFAPVKCKIIDVRASGWWGKKPSGVVSLGDGIVQLEILETVGPFIKGHHIGLGHCEKAVVKMGQIVEPGDKVARVGLAVVWHIHLMYNDGSTTKGIGNLDPRKILDYAQAHG